MKHLRICLGVFIFALAIASCKKETFNINKNPNNATDSTIVYNLILPSAQNNTGRLVARNWGWLQDYLSFWARSGTFAPVAQEETYQLTTTQAFVSNIWNGVYDNNYDYQAMEISANKAGATFYSGIAKIMKAHNYGILFDVYGNAPLTEALKGGANATPKYDMGKDAYASLLVQLDEGIALVKDANELTTGPNKTIPTDDVMFGTKLYPGTTIPAMKIKWMKFANTIKLRLLVHLMNGGVQGAPGDNTVGTPASVVPGFNIPAEFAKIVATGVGYLAPGIDAQVQPGYATDRGNPFYNLYIRDNTNTQTGTNQYQRANEYAINYYNFNLDPRIGKFYDPVSGNTFRGVKYGLPANTANSFANLSSIGAGVARGVDQPQWIMTATESLFLQAEATHRGFNTGSAGSALSLTNAGITESFMMLGLTAAQANTYISNNATYADVDYNAAAQPGAGNAKGGIFTIISQKWFALNAIAPFEIWTDYRRVDFSTSIKHFEYGKSVGYVKGPQISVLPANLATEIPIRLPYPQDEYNYNTANVSAQGNINIFTNRIFWDLN